MTKILGLSGSLRKGSFNAALLRAAVRAAPDGIQIEIGDISDVPLFNQDDEQAHGLPQAVLRLQAQLKAADGLLMVTPEYNNGVPGVFKNVIDWMSRGDGLSIFRGKPVAMIGASPGGFGTVLSQSHWLPVLRSLSVLPWQSGRLLVSKAGAAFDPSGELTDPAVRENLGKFVAGFASFVGEERRPG